MKNHSLLKPPEKNHSATVPRAQVLLGSDTLQFQHNTTTDLKLQKLPPSGKEYFFKPEEELPS